MENKIIYLNNKRFILYPDGKLFNVLKKKYLKPTNNGKGYLMYEIRNNGIKNKIQVSRLVAKHYIQNTEKLPIVNHLDGVKSNNHYSNLEWTTYSKNIKHAISTGLIKLKESELHGPIKSKPVLKIGKNSEVIAEYKSISNAAKLLMLDKNAISKVCLGKQLTAYGFKWKFKTA